MRRWTRIAALALAGAGLAGPAGAQDRYIFVDLGTDTGGPIDDTGQIAIVRYARDGQGRISSANTRLFGPQIGTNVDLGNIALPSRPGAFAASFQGNAAGQLVGSYEAAGPYSRDPTGVAGHAFIWTPDPAGDGTQGTLQDIGFRDEQLSFVAGVSDSGQVAGTSWSPYIFDQFNPDVCIRPPLCPGMPFVCWFVTSRAFRWTEDEGIVDLGAFSGPHGKGLNSFVGGFVFQQGTDADGAIVGRASVPILRANDATGSFLGHPFLWTRSGGMRDLSPPPLDPCLDPDSVLDPCTACRHGVHFDGQADYVDNGEVAGTWSMVDLDNPLNSSFGHGFFWSEATGFVDIGTLGGKRSTVNGLRMGEVVGSSHPTGSTAGLVTLPAAAPFVAQPNGPTIITPALGPGITMPPGATVQLANGTTAPLAAGTAITLQFFTVVTLPDGTMGALQGSPSTAATLSSGTTVTLFSSYKVRPSNGPIALQLPAGAIVSLPAATSATLSTASTALSFTNGQIVSLPAGSIIQLPSAWTATLPGGATTTISFGTTMPAGTTVPLLPPVELPDGTTVTLPSTSAIGQPAGTYTLPHVGGLVTQPPTATLPGSVVTLPDATTVPLPYGTIILEAALRAYHWQFGTPPIMTDLHHPEWTARNWTASAAEDTRPAGGVYDSQTVGAYVTSDGDFHAVLWTQGLAYDLHPCGWRWSRAHWIDDYGNVGIQGQDGAGAFHMALYVPEASGEPLGPKITSCPAPRAIIATTPVAGGLAAVVPDLTSEVVVCYGGPVTITQDPPAGTVERAGALTLTFTVTSVTSGLQDTCSTTITVLERVKPRFLPPIHPCGPHIFTSGCTIPLKIGLFDSSCRNVTREVGPYVTVTLDVDELDKTSSFRKEIVERYNGVGAAGSRMVLLGNHFQYNLATNPTDYRRRTISSSRYFRATATVTFNDAPDAWSESTFADLESR